MKRKKDDRSYELLKLDYEHSRTFTTVFLAAAVSFSIVLWIAHESDKEKLTLAFGSLALVTGLSSGFYSILMEKDFRLLRDLVKKKK